MSKEFLGKVAIVSGDGSGIGAETAKILAGAGALVVLSDISLPAAEGIADEITRASGKAAAFRANVAKAEDAQPRSSSPRRHTAVCIWDSTMPAS